MKPLVCRLKTSLKRSDDTPKKVEGRWEGIDSASIESTASSLGKKWTDEENQTRVGRLQAKVFLSSPVQLYVYHLRVRDSSPTDYVGDPILSHRRPWGHPVSVVL